MVSKLSLRVKVHIRFRRSNGVKSPDLGDGTTSGTTTDHPAIAFTANSTICLEV